MATLIYLSCLLLVLSLPETLWGRVVIYPDDPYSQELSKPDFVPQDEPFTNLTMDELIRQAYEFSGGHLQAPMPDPSNLNATMLVEMDIKMSTAEYLALYSDDNENTRTKRKATRPDYRRWTNGVIPYEFITSDFTANQVYQIKVAMQEWEDNTCLHFRPARRSDPSRIRFQNGIGCNAWLGMHRGTNIVNLDKNGCRYRGLYLHEVGHSIGLVHEHQLPDRDDYITILMNNVTPNMRVWFNKYTSKTVNQYNVLYEYSSVMHYGITAFSKDKRSQTIRTKDPSREREIGRVFWKELSFSDIKVVNLMYKCNKKCPSDPKCKEPGYLDKNCKCICPEGMDCGYGVKECKNVFRDNQKCDNWASKGECRNNPAWMWAFCKKSCGACPRVTKPVTARPGRTNRPTRRPATQRTTTETTVVTECKNVYRDNQKCDNWASSGECMKNPTWMLVSCTKSCGACPKVTKPVTARPGRTNRPTRRPVTQRPTRRPTRTTTETTVVTNCRNKYDERQCKAFAKRGDCDTNPRWTRVNCAKSCRSCPGTCINMMGDKYCGKKALSGWCKSQSSWMKKNCLQSCRLCNSDPKEDCKDTHTACLGWAKAGYCSNNKPTAEKCRKSCRFC